MNPNIKQLRNTLKKI